MSSSPSALSRLAGDSRQRSLEHLAPPAARCTSVHCLSEISLAFDGTTVASAPCQTDTRGRGIMRRRASHQIAPCVQEQRRTLEHGLESLLDIGRSAVGQTGDDPRRRRRHRDKPRA